MLERKGIELKLVYGQASGPDALKRDEVEISWGTKIRNTILQIGEKQLYWQPLLRHIRGANLIIVEPGSKYLVNFILLVLSMFGGPRIALWGHGENFQKTHAVWISEWIKRIVAKRAHWYFAYTARTARIVHGWGYPLERMTVVQNAIDTRHLTLARAAIKDEDLAKLRGELGLVGKHVALYVGGMYKEKRLEFLMEACKIVRQRVPDFEMLMLGSGTDAQIVVECAQHYPWLHYLGPKFGDEKVPFFASSKLFLMPGLIGLAVLDCFALGVPLVGTENPDNSHEVEYLIDGMNGVILKDDITPSHYAQVVADLMVNEEQLRGLTAGCALAAERYTVEHMIDNFAEGVEKAIQDCPSSSWAGATDAGA